MQHGKLPGIKNNKRRFMMPSAAPSSRLSDLKSKPWLIYQPDIAFLYYSAYKPFQEKQYQIIISNMLANI
jgi:hypothetical protein